jgi:predicted membrane protein
MAKLLAEDCFLSKTCHADLKQTTKSEQNYDVLKNFQNGVNKFDIGHCRIFIWSVCAQFIHSCTLVHGSFVFARIFLHAQLSRLWDAQIFWLCTSFLFMPDFFIRSQLFRSCTRPVRLFHWCMTFPFRHNFSLHA